VVVAALFNAGDQVPIIPLLEVVVKADKLSPTHIGSTAVNVGVILGFTVALAATFCAIAPVEVQVILPDGVPKADAVKRT
jgi:hypothetical protein